MSSISPVAKPLRSTRSRVTNGTSLHSGDVDGRSAAAKRFRDVLAEMIGDLGGADLLSEGQRQLCRRAALMSVEAEKMEAAAVAGEAFDLDAFGALSDRLGRCLNRLGLKRVARELHSPILDHFSRPPERAA